MRPATDTHIMPRLLNGDPCPNCGRPLRITTMDRTRRLGSIVFEALPMIPVAMFLGLLGSSDAAMMLGHNHDPIEDAIYVVGCEGCGDAFDVWGGRDAGDELESRMPDE